MHRLRVHGIETALERPSEASFGPGKPPIARVIESSPSCHERQHSMQSRRTKRERPPGRTTFAVPSALLAALVPIARADDPPTLQSGDDSLADVFSLDLQYARTNGFVQVRETTHPGTRLPLQDLGLDSAEVATLALDQRLGDEARLRWRLRWYYAA